MIIEHPVEAVPYYDRRRQAIKNSLAGADYDALLVTHLPNVRYLSGFSGTSATMLITPDIAIFLTDFRYVDQSRDEVQGDVLLEEYKEPLESVANLLKKHGIKRIGFDEHGNR